VASLLGKKELLEAYDFAIKNKMRLFSYGDGMLII
jgi:S-adenosylmethionine:tRNA-ribosyltransferase-isomerase (queuine synthetase)